MCVALNNCDLCVLNSNDLKAVMKDFPNSARRLEVSERKSLRPLRRVSEVTQLSPPQSRPLIPHHDGHRSCCSFQEEAAASVRQLQVAGRAGFMDSDNSDDDNDLDYPEYDPGGGEGVVLETVAEEAEDMASTGVSKGGFRTYGRFGLMSVEMNSGDLTPSGFSS